MKSYFIGRVDFAWVEMPSLNNEARLKLISTDFIREIAPSQPTFTTQGQARKLSLRPGQPIY